MKKYIKKQNIFDRLMIQEIITSSVTMACIEFIFYIFLLKINKMEISVIRSYLLTLMIFMENIQIFNCRNERKSIIKISGQDNRFLIFSIVITSLIQLIIIRVTFLSNILKISTISLENAGLLFLFTIPLIIVMEIFKYGVRKRETFSS